MSSWIFHNGHQVVAPRIYPAVQAVKVLDQNLGEHKTVNKPADAEQTLKRLIQGAPSNTAYDLVQKDMIRALIAGITQGGQPKLLTQDQLQRQELLKLYAGTHSGHLQVELLHAERINLGVDTRKVYLADMMRMPLSSYAIKEEGPDAETATKTTQGYTQTVIGLHRHPDGEPYAVFASPKDMFPKMTKLADLPMVVAPELELELPPASKTSELTM
jgi:hypothetical protein